MLLTTWWFPKPGETSSIATPKATDPVSSEITRLPPPKRRLRNLSPFWLSTSSAAPVEATFEIRASIVRSPSVAISCITGPAATLFSLPPS